MVKKWTHRSTQKRYTIFTTGCDFRLRVLQTSCYHRAVSKENIFLLLLLVCLFLTSHQQLRSYGDPRLKAGNRSCDPRFTRQAVYPLHQSGSYILTTELSCPTESLVHDVECVTVLLFCSSRTAHENP